MACRILVPETASYPTIAQIAACGADVATIKASRQDVAEAALRQNAEIFYASHNWQPFFVEGIKTLAYELWEQLGFRAPDNLVVPSAAEATCWAPSAASGSSCVGARSRDARASSACRRRTARRIKPRSWRTAIISSPPRSRPRWRSASPCPSPRAWPRCHAR